MSLSSRAPWSPSGDVRNISIFKVLQAFATVSQPFTRGGTIHLGHLKSTSVLVIAVATTGCASFNISVGRDANRNNTRQEVAGTTLACAGGSQRSAVTALVVSALAGSGASLLASAATNASLNRSPEATALATASIAGSIVALAANIAAWVFLGNSIAYTERAGLVLAGLENDGCNESGTLPRTSYAETPGPSPSPVIRTVPKAADPAPAAGKCTDAEVAEMKRSGMSASAVERACLP